MRSLALFLILINLVFYAWQFKFLTWLPWQPEQFIPRKWSIPSYFNDTPINIAVTKKIVKIEQTKKLISTWIYLPPFKNRKAAIRAEYRLKQKGIGDFMIITKGKFKYAISLGFFSKTKYLNRRIKQLKAKGVNNFKLQERYKKN